MAGPVKMATSDHQDTAFSALSSHVFEQIDFTVRSQQLILKKKRKLSQTTVRNAEFHCMQIVIPVTLTPETGRSKGQPYH